MCCNDSTPQNHTSTHKRCCCPSSGSHLSAWVLVPALPLQILTAPLLCAPWQPPWTAQQRPLVFPVAPLLLLLPVLLLLWPLQCDRGTIRPTLSVPATQGNSSGVAGTMQCNLPLAWASDVQLLASSGDNGDAWSVKLNSLPWHALRATHPLQHRPLGVGQLWLQLQPPCDAPSDAAA